MSSRSTPPSLRNDEANPCLFAPVFVGELRDDACVDSSTHAAAKWPALSKSAAEVRRVRDEVLEILSSQNACRDWFAGKERDVQQIFGSLRFLVDPKGQEDVFAMPAKNSTIIRQPYVASATQDGGAHTNITLNAYGAFYRSQAKFEALSPEGGPNQFRGEYWLSVGPYSGNSLEAQTLTLLHELGHVIDLLPEDSGDLHGKSASNTSEVLRHCRSQIEAYSKRFREIAKK